MQNNRFGIAHIAVTASLAVSFLSYTTALGRDVARIDTLTKEQSKRIDRETAGISSRLQRLEMKIDHLLERNP